MIEIRFFPRALGSVFFFFGEREILELNIFFFCGLKNYNHTLQTPPHPPSPFQKMTMYTRNITFIPHMHGPTYSNERYFPRAS